MCTALRFSESLLATVAGIPPVAGKFHAVYRHLHEVLNYSSVAALDVCLCIERGEPLAECGSLDREDVGVVRELLEDAR